MTVQSRLGVGTMFPCTMLLAGTVPSTARPLST